jgi:hypothetical protein
LTLPGLHWKPNQATRTCKRIQKSRQSLWTHSRPSVSMINPLVRPFLCRTQRPLSRYIPRHVPSILTTQRLVCNQSQSKPLCSSKAAPPLSLTSPEFWKSAPIWRRAGINTLRCLIGCTAGDFSAMWYLQAFHPELGMPTIMAISSVFHSAILLHPTNTKKWHLAFRHRYFLRLDFFGTVAIGYPGGLLSRRLRV